MPQRLFEILARFWPVLGLFALFLVHLLGVFHNLPLNIRLFVDSVSIGDVAFGAIATLTLAAFWARMSYTAVLVVATMRVFLICKYPFRKKGKDKAHLRSPSMSRYRRLSNKRSYAFLSRYSVLVHSVVGLFFVFSNYLAPPVFIINLQNAESVFVTFFLAPSTALVAFLLVFLSFGHSFRLNGLPGHIKFLSEGAGLAFMVAFALWLSFVFGISRHQRLIDDGRSVVVLASEEVSGSVVFKTSIGLILFDSVSLSYRFVTFEQLVEVR